MSFLIAVVSIGVCLALVREVMILRGIRKRVEREGRTFDEWNARRLAARRATK